MNGVHPMLAAAQARGLTAANLQAWHDEYGVYTLVPPPCCPDPGSVRSLRLPRSWMPLAPSGPVDCNVRYVPPQALTTIPWFVEGIVAAYIGAGRDWLVIEAPPYRARLASDHVLDLEQMGAAMLRVIDIDLSVAGDRYVVSRANACRLGAHGPDSARRFEPAGVITCTPCERNVR